MLRSSGHDVVQALRIVAGGASVTGGASVASNSGPQPSKLNVRGSSPLARFGVPRCATPRNIACSRCLRITNNSDWTTFMLRGFALICTVSHALRPGLRAPAEFRLTPFQSQRPVHDFSASGAMSVFMASNSGRGGCCQLAADHSWKSQGLRAGAPARQQQQQIGEIDLPGFIEITDVVNLTPVVD